MIERAAMPLVADKLRPEMFYEEKNLEIFCRPAIDVSQRKSIDTITLKNELAARGKLDAVGGPYELLRISSKVSSSAHLEYHALIPGNCTRGVSCVRDSSNCWRSVPTSRWILTTSWWKPIDCWRGWRTRAA